jgi:hypothetical protein
MKHRSRKRRRSRGTMVLRTSNLSPGTHAGFAALVGEDASVAGLRITMERGKHDRIGVATPGAHSCNAPPSHKFSPKRRGRHEANHLAKCKAGVPATIEKTIVSAILCERTWASNAGRQLKRSPGSPIEQEHDAVPEQVDADPGKRHDSDSDETPRPWKHRALPSPRNDRDRRLAQLTLFGSLWLHENLPGHPAIRQVSTASEPAGWIACCGKYNPHARGEIALAITSALGSQPFIAGMEPRRSAARLFPSPCFFNKLYLPILGPATKADLTPC